MYVYIVIEFNKFINDCRITDVYCNKESAEKKKNRYEKNTGNVATYHIIKKRVKDPMMLVITEKQATEAFIKGKARI